MNRPLHDEESPTSINAPVTPSAEAAAQSVRAGNVVMTNQNPKHNPHQYHRWPSYALDATTRPPEIVAPSFLFADQISVTEDDNNAQDGEENSSFHGSHPAGGFRKRAPINILKLPWQHPFRHHESNRNPYKIPRALFAALFLTTTLALLSAWDAQLHCVSNEADAILALLGEYNSKGGGYEQQQAADSGDYAYNYAHDQDDEETALSELAMLEVKQTCRKMFHRVMLPVGIVTALGSLSALGILRQHQRSYASQSLSQNLSDSKRSLVAQSPPCFYSFYLPLLFVSGLILIVWTVGIVLVMLQPRMNNTDNPYTSLAAVDGMGRVADNANLYYTAWMSELIAIFIFYQLGGAFVRQHWLPKLPVGMPTIINLNSSGNSAASNHALTWKRTAFAAQRSPMLESSMDNSMLQKQLSPQSLLNHQEATSQQYNSSRIKWFHTFYQLRVRTGLWGAALLSSLVVVATSAHIFHEILLPAAQSLFDDDDYLYYENHSNWWNVIENKKSYGEVCVTLAAQDSNLSEQLCRRTFFSLLSGFISVILCSTAIFCHFLTRRSAAADALYLEALNLEACGGQFAYHELALELMATNHRHHLPLRSELLLSVVLSIWLGWNALWVSSTQGPAPRVSNLYYSSWASFLLCLRICLGCIEEYFEILHNHDDDHHRHSSGQEQKQTSSYQAPGLSDIQEGVSTEGIKANNSTPQSAAGRSKSMDSTPELKKKTIRDEIERERAKRLRRFFMLSAFSTVSAGSAFDAAKNQNFVLTSPEKYMMLAPAAVALLSAILFLLCLSKVTYTVVSRFLVGGILSLLMFWTWLANLLLTMHSGDSWAVNRVGEIEMANIYYFSWASIVTAGLQLTSFVKDALNIKNEPYMVVMWSVMGKVCFVILGAAGHIWHTISDQCDIVEIQNSAITFCSRTILAMIIPSTALLICGLVLFVRILVPLRWFSEHSRAHFEGILSIFLLLLFGTAAGMITGIGGPGQSVGDLYYSVWLAFWISIGIFVSCYDQIKVEEMEESNQSLKKTESLASKTGAMV